MGNRPDDEGAGPGPDSWPEPTTAGRSVTMRALIVGAGIAGPVAAMALHRGGVESAVLDRPPPHRAGRRASHPRPGVLEWSREAAGPGAERGATRRRHRQRVRPAQRPATGPPRGGAGPRRHHPVREAARAPGAWRGLGHRPLRRRHPGGRGHPDRCGRHPLPHPTADPAGRAAAGLHRPDQRRRLQPAARARTDTRVPAVHLRPAGFFGYLVRDGGEVWWFANAAHPVPRAPSPGCSATRRCPEPPAIQAQLGDPPGASRPGGAPAWMARTVSMVSASAARLSGR
jgi:hypothetical protein